MAKNMTIETSSSTYFCTPVKRNAFNAYIDTLTRLRLVDRRVVDARSSPSHAAGLVATPFVDSLRSS